MGIFTKKLQLFTVGFEKDPVPAGEVVHGKVVIDLAEPMKMRGIHVEFYGYAWVRFRGFVHHNQWMLRRGYHTFKSRQNYYKHSVIVFGKEKGKIFGDNVELEAGHHEFPFAFELTASTPPSAEFKHGSIRHQVKVTIDKPWKIDHVLRKRLTVAGRIDLNEECFGPVSKSTQKMLGCICCPAGTLIMNVRLPRAAFVPGEYIIFGGQLKNESSRRIKSYIFRLRQNTDYRADYPKSKSKYTTRVVGEVKRKKGIEPFQTIDLTTEAFLVPPLPASGLGGCTIMDCHYFLEIQARDLLVVFPLTIATHPPQSVPAVFANEPYNPDWYNPKVPIEFPPPSTFNPTPADQPPLPSYYEAVGEKLAHDSEDEEKGLIKHGDDPWAPSYSYYTWT